MALSDATHDSGFNVIEIGFLLPNYKICIAQ